MSAIPLHQERPAPKAAVAPSAPPPSPARRAALLLHAMTAPERAWVLERLPQAEREELTVFLEELSALGIPADRKLLGDVVATVGDDDSARGRAPNGAEASDLEIDALTGADPARLAGLLREEPAALIASLLRLHAWPWRDALLKRLDPVKRTQVEQRMREVGGPRPGGVQDAPALRAALLQAVARRLGPAVGRSGGSGWRWPARLVSAWRRR